MGIALKWTEKRTKNRIRTIGSKLLNQRIISVNKKETSKLAQRLPNLRYVGSSLIQFFCFLIHFSSSQTFFSLTISFIFRCHSNFHLNSIFDLVSQLHNEHSFLFRLRFLHFIHPFAHNRFVKTITWLFCSPSLWSYFNFQVDRGVGIRAGWLEKIAKFEVEITLEGNWSTVWLWPQIECNCMTDEVENFTRISIPAVAIVVMWSFQMVCIAKSNNVRA